MQSKRDLLTYLAKRPYWAMLRAAVEEFYLRSILKAESSDDLIIERSAAHARVQSVAAAVAGQFTASAPTGTKIAVIPIQGSLGNDSFWDDTTYSFLQDAIDTATNDPQIAEIILLVDSPGGDVVGLPETADMIYAATKVKPVTAVVNGMAASAAYHLVSQATSIVLNPSGEVGSVGVFTIHTDITEMLAKEGIKLTPISAGDHKLEWFPFSPLTEEAKKAAQEDVDRFYNGFLSAIARGRGSRVTPDMAATNYGNGRMLNAEDALNGGLVDKISTVRDVFRARSGARLIQTRLGLEKKRLELLSESD